jgi:hypothetical protein
MEGDGKVGIQCHRSMAGKTGYSSEQFFCHSYNISIRHFPKISFFKAPALISPAANPNRPAFTLCHQTNDLLTVPTQTICFSRTVLLPTSPSSRWLPSHRHHTEQTRAPKNTRSTHTVITIGLTVKSLSTQLLASHPRRLSGSRDRASQSNWWRAGYDSTLATLIPISKVI